MLVYTLSPLYARQVDTLRQMAATASLWQTEAANLLERVTANFSDLETMLQTMHDLQRMVLIEDAGLAQNAEFKTMLAATPLISWKDFTAPPADIALQHSLADRIYNIDPQKKDVAFINLAANSRVVGLHLVQRCIDNAVPFLVGFDDPDFHALVLNHADDASVESLAKTTVSQLKQVTKVMAVLAGLRDVDGIRPDHAKEKIYTVAMKPHSSRITSGDLFYTLTRIPTPKDAEIDAIDYDDYIKLFFEMCDQPWAHIDRAQRALIAEFNAAKTARFTNNYGTDLRMNIDGFTFCNSLIAKNVPGSEIFSAPHKNSVEGKIVSRGRFTREGRVVEDLTLEFNKGHLVRYKAEKGHDIFDKIVNIDDGARYVGEIGIGTNPHLKQHVSNTLLVEKIGGSFHVALGAAYSYTEYGGEPVKVDNGNKSGLHWDITTMLHGADGRVYLDDRIVMDDGKWIDPKYDVLNRGWAAISRQDRPAYWTSYYPEDKGKAPAP